MCNEMKRYCFAIIFICSFIGNLFSQEIKFSVKDFYLDENDFTASVPPDLVIDQNGKACARIKIETQYDLSIEVGFGGITKRERKGGEIWVYLPYQTRKFKSLSHIDLGIIRDYPLQLESGRTYIMKINEPLRVLPRGHEITGPPQNVKIKVVPRNANIAINGITHKQDSLGILQLEMAQGIHDISVHADKYHSTTRRINVDEANEGKMHIIQLKQAFGWLIAKLDKDETLFLDDKEYDPSLYVNNAVEVKSGNYRVRVEKQMHKPYSTTLQIADSAIVELAPNFVPMFSIVNFVVNNYKAEIWIDGRFVGKGNWTGRLGYGKHIVETKLDRHRTQEHDFDITPSTASKIELKSPEPIYGQLVVSTDPSGAEVYMDNVKVGVTPYSQSVLVGTYTLSIKKDGYTPETKRIEIVENERAFESIKLNNVFPVSFTVKPSYSAKVFIDDRIVTNYSSMMLEAGVHSLEITARGYQTLKKKISVEKPYQNFYYRLKRKLYSKGQFYLGGTASYVNEYLMYGGYIGFYAGNFNVEASYMMGDEPSERIYWNSSQGMERPSSFTYLPTEIGGRIGVGIMLGRGARLTPQIGAGYMTLKADETWYSYPSGSNDFAETCDALSFKAGLKLNIALGGFMELSVRPEYSTMIMKSNVYEALCEASPVIEGWSNGFVINAGFGFYF